MLQSLREETEGKLQMLVSLRKNGLTSFKEARGFKEPGASRIPKLEGTRKSTDPSPTLCQPFANLFCQPFLPTFSANPSPSPSFRGLQAPVYRHGLTASW